MTVICDYLDCTLPPDSLTFEDVSPFFDGVEGSWRAETGFKFLSRDGGSFHFGVWKRFQRLSASGRVLEHFRALGVFQDYLGMIADYPHNVTRLDAALDVGIPASEVIPGLYERDAQGYVFHRKAVPVKWTQSLDLEGRASGSVMYGHRKHNLVSALVYDKQLEAWERRGEVLPPRTRYELRLAREASPTLRDALSPAPVFFSFMSPAFLPRPPDVPPWEPLCEPWRPGRAPVRLPAERMGYVVDSCSDLDVVARLALEIGPEGIPWALKLIRERMERYQRAEGEAQAPARPPADRLN